MFAEIISRLLNEFLGTFIHTPPSDAIKVKLLQGRLALRDVEIRADALDGLLYLIGFPWSLPVEIARGTVSLIDVDLPITSLGNKPAKIVVNGVQIAVRLKPDAVPGSPTQGIGTEACRARAATLYKLFRSQAYTDKKIMRVIANASIAISDVHVVIVEAGCLFPRSRRVLDVLAGVPVRLYLTIESINAITVNEAGVPAFCKDTAVVRKSVVATGMVLHVGDVPVSESFNAQCTVSLNLTVRGLLWKVKPFPLLLSLDNGNRRRRSV
jgi:hypothetical protein